MRHVRMAGWEVVKLWMDTCRFPKVFGFGGVFGCHLSSSCGFDCLVNKRSGCCNLPANLTTTGDWVDEGEEAVGLTEAGQIPITAIPVFPSLSKSIAWNHSRLAIFLKMERVA